MKRVEAEEMALSYWNRMRRFALKEVEFKLAQFKHASPNTVRYWLAVHSWLEARCKYPPQRKA